MDRTIAALERIQQQLERTYDVEIPHHVGEFLITDPQLLRNLRPPDIDETVPRSPEARASKPAQPSNCWWPSTTTKWISGCS